MRAGKIASLVLVLIVTLVATGVRAFSFWAFDLEQATAATRVLVFAAVIAGVALFVLFPIGIIVDRALSHLRQSIERMSHASTPGAAPRTDASASAAQSKWLKPLTRALVGAVDRFRQREQALRAQLNDLEIRHRVSEAHRRQIEAVLHSLRDGVIVTDAFGELVMANQAAAEILGFDCSTSLHKPIDEVISNERVRRLVHDVRDAADFACARHVELTIGEAQTQSESALGADSKHACTYNVMLSCVENHKHEVAGVVTLLHDLTREREVSQMKSDFVSKASHELRTPLSSIRAYVEMLVDGEAADETSRQEFYRIIQGETDRLGRLIDNMLNISRIEAGIVQIEREYVDVKALITRAIHTLEPQATEKKLSLHARVSDVDLCVEGDADMLYQVVLNLVSNAVKYTPEGGRITVAGDSMGEIRTQRVDIARTGANARSESPGIAATTKAAATTAGTKHAAGRSATSSAAGGAAAGLAASHAAARLASGPAVVVSVSDTGLGIPPDSLPKLFDKFYRVENYKRVAKGTGLGLSLCKHIVETVHGGQIGVESKLGMGSKFWFSVPVKYAGGAGKMAA